MKIIFTRHSELRMEKRNISKEEVIETIKNPDRTLKRHGMYYFQKNMGGGPIEVVVEKTQKNLNVVTVYWL